MRLMDEINVKWPFFGVPRMHKYLVTLGYRIDGKRIFRLFQVMGVAAIYPGPNTSKADKDHEIYPYLLKSIAISYSNYVWSTDINLHPDGEGLPAIRCLDSTFL
jgi:putative transposase